MPKKRRITAEWMAFTGLLVAMQVVLGSLVQVQIGNWKQFNFGFLAIATSGILMGPFSAMIVGALGDIIGTLLFPTGAYFPGFTLSNIIVGAIYGLLLRRGRRDMISESLESKNQELLVRAVISSIAVAVVYLFLNSLWLSILYGSKTYMMWLGTRAASNLVEIPICSALIYILQLALIRLPGSFLPSADFKPKNKSVDGGE